MPTLRTDTIEGTNVVEQGKPVATFDEGRVCLEDGCGTVLSRYNASDLCWQHAPLKFSLARGIRRKKDDR